MNPWTEKYRPDDISSVCGNQEKYNEIAKLNYEMGTALIHGPPGTGKTTTIRSILKDVDEESVFIFDMSLKSSETSKNMTRILNNFIKKHTKLKHKIVIVDEVDCMRVIDQKVFKNLLSQSLLKKSSYSISVLFLCNNINKVSEFIVKNCKNINFNLLKFEQVFTYLFNICESEQISVRRECLNYIFNNCGNDLRKTITTMQYLYMMTGEISKQKYDETMDLVDINDKIIDDLFSKPLKEAVDTIYYEGISVIDFIDKFYHYHKDRGKITHEYIKILAGSSNIARNTSDTWFVLCYIISESPLFKEHLKLGSIQ